MELVLLEQVVQSITRQNVYHVHRVFIYPDSYVNLTNVVVQTEHQLKGLITAHLHQKSYVEVTTVTSVKAATLVIMSQAINAI